MKIFSKMLVGFVFIVLINACGGGGGGGPDPVPGTLQFNATSYSGDEDAAAISVSVTRTGGSDGAVSADMSDAGSGSATSGTDYTAITATTLSWANGDSAAKTFIVSVTADGTFEPDETVVLALGNATGGASLGTTSTTVTILNDDVAGPGTLQFSPTSYTEAEDGTVTITVTRTGGDTGAVAVDYATSNGTATAPSDYTATSDTLSWATGDSSAKSFTVPINNDTDVENNETVNLTLSGVTGGATLGTSTATLTITNEDACTSTANDSVQTPGGWNRIHSEDNSINNGIYHLVTLTRETLVVGPTITMDYMVHEPPGTPAALLVLISGGQLNSAIEGVDGLAPTNAGKNFLVRSAHLFAAQGYRVLTIDRPSDYLDYTGGLGSGRAYDGYRTSMAHAVDLSQLINIVNAADNLPVIIAGTSRGSISAVAQHALASALAISSPLTSGNGSPIGTANVLPANVPGPVHVSWHVDDSCDVTTPANALSLVSDFPNATGIAISGGFASISATPCDADHYHGFPGIESCAVKQATDWMTDKLVGLPDTRPVASAHSNSTTQDTPLVIDLSVFVTDAVGGALTYSLPHTSTSLGGSISIAGTSVTYTPPSGVSDIVDTFVYVVSEAGGGTSHNVIAVTINP